MEAKDEGIRLGPALGPVSIVIAEASGRVRETHAVRPKMTRQGLLVLAVLFNSRSPISV